MPLVVGNASPEFSLPLVQGGEFVLSRVLKNGPAVLNFIRGTWCEECTQHLRKIREWQSLLVTKRIRVTTVIISCETGEKLREWLNENHTPYLLASDPSGGVAEQFGLKVPEDAYSKPAMVLIDPSGTIRIIEGDLRTARESTAKELGINESK